MGNRLTDHQLQEYFRRVGYTGAAIPSLDTLIALHRAHLLAIPYENLDIHLGRALVLDQQANFDKLVRQGRGGWCYEMNGAFGLVLESLGYDVRYVAGTVDRATRGDAVDSNHLVLIVTLDRHWIVDVGFGDGFLEPIPLDVGTYRREFLDFAVSHEGERWYVHNHRFSSTKEFDFTLEPRRLDHFAAKAHELQTSPTSGFVLTTVCQRYVADGLVTLRGAMLRRLTAAGVEDRTLESAEEFSDTLHSVFGLSPVGVERLWESVMRRHWAWLESQRAE